MAAMTEKQDVIDAIYRLAYSLDALNAASWTELFPQEKKVNFDVSAILGIPARDVTPAEHYNMAVDGLGGFDATQHIVGNPLVTASAENKFHVKAMVVAFHGLIRSDRVDGATARVFWHIDLEKEQDKLVIVRWVIERLLPIDNHAVFEEGHKRAHDGRLRKGIVKM